MEEEGVFQFNGLDEVPEDVTHVRVDSFVPVIHACAFQSRELPIHRRRPLVEVELPEGLTAIERQAFSNCMSLKRINIPSTVKEIGYSAFSQCYMLEVVDLPKGLQRLGSNAFSHCRSLLRINIPPNIKTIESSAFFGCSSLTEVTFTEGIQEIQSDAFSFCGDSLVSVTLPSSLKVIGVNSFQFSSLKELHMHDTVHTIGEGVFRGNNFTNFRMPPLVNRFDISVLAENISLVSLELSENVRLITDTSKQLWDSDDDDSDYGDEYDNANINSLRNIALPSGCRTSAMPLEGCEDLEAALPYVDLDNTLRERFDNLPIHKLCYYQSYHDTQATVQSLRRQLYTTGKQQDCLGMTPLHILACSTKPTIEIYRLLIENYPKTLIVKDKWGDIPLLYALWCNAPAEIVDLLVESYKSNHTDYEIDWKGMILTLAKRDVPLANIQTLINTQQSGFPDQEYDMQQVVMELAVQDTTGSTRGYHKPYICIKTFKYLLRASVAERLESLDVKRFQEDLKNSINAVSEKKGRKEDTQALYDKLAAYEIAKEGTSVLELAVWKAKIDTNRNNKRAKVSSEISYKDQCRMNCGAGIIIRNVLPYLLPNETTIPK